eukprot:m.370334 g.370334  ORF g.370334 m.370334 type:complete len:475 (+) comp54034_c0_seq1:90-1514(+)
MGEVNAQRFPRTWHLACQCVLVCLSILLLKCQPTTACAVDDISACVDAILLQTVDPHLELRAGVQTVLLTTSTYAYRHVTLNFFAAVKKSSNIQPATISLLCLDQEAKEFFAQHDIRCVALQVREPINGNYSTQSHRTISDPESSNHQKEKKPPSKEMLAQIWLARLSIVQQLVNRGIDVLLSDTDAVWVRDPLPSLRRELQHTSQPSILAQRGRFPFHLGHVWGSTLCFGFIYFRGTTAVQELFRLMFALIQAGAEPDDQVLLNTALHLLNPEFITPIESPCKRSASAQRTISKHHLRPQLCWSSSDVGRMAIYPLHSGSYQPQHPSQLEHPETSAQRLLCRRTSHHNVNARGKLKPSPAELYPEFFTTIVANEALDRMQSSRQRTTIQPAPGPVCHYGEPVMTESSRPFTINGPPSPMVVSLLSYEQFPRFCPTTDFSKGLVIHCQSSKDGRSKMAQLVHHNLLFIDEHQQL